MSGIAGRAPGADDLLYAQSVADDRVFLLTVGRQAGRPPFLINGGFFFQNGIGSGSNTGGIGADSRGIVFRDGGDRAFLVNRSPPALQEYDTSIGPTGVPVNRVTATTDICRDATSVSAVATGAGERAYVTCYADGEVYVVDPRAGGSVEATALTGRGPLASAAVPRWFTPTVGLAFRAGDHVRARIAWESDLAPKYASHGVALKLDFLSRDGDD